MEAASLAFSVAQTLFAALQSSELKHLFTMFGYKSELEKLEKTVNTIRSVLLDADAKRELNQQQIGWLENLRVFVYNADDLLDEFATVAAQEKQRLAEKHGGFSDKVGRLFSRFKRLCDTYKMPKKVKKLRKIMDDIANDVDKFSFKVDYQPLRRRREETCSYVYQSDIIGREKDVDRVKELLLNPNVEHHIPVLTIVGIGGLGKTTLAQLVFNDKRICDEFSLRLWACVSDEGQSQLNVDSVLGSILKSATDETRIDKLNTEQLQRKLRGKLEGKKYLLVLDDVWTEENWEWLNLAKYLKGGQEGSRIVVTTRSKATAIAVGSNGELIYELSSLSSYDSWLLFEVTVGEQQANRSDLIEIGQAIVKKCASVPLAIKVIGTLLHGQREDKWRSFQNSNLFEIRKDKNDIMHILKYTYDHLTPSLKSCFSYCAIFPKDHVIEKEMLISLWMAQGYVEPLDGGQSMEDAAAENFLILVRRCFFQDIKKDEYGEIVSCKIHDLMHDVALAVTKKEICIGNADSMSSLDENIRHMSRACKNCVKSISTMSKLRTYLDDDFHWESKRPVQLFVGELFGKLKCLRALDLSNIGIESLPDTIGGLLHLRYLDLSNNYVLEVLPKSITQLYNLQTLILVGCSKLRELPSDSSRLVNLRVLDITECDGLMYMPSGMKTLTCLCELGMFIVGGRSLKQSFGELEDLGALNKLKGSLKIQFSKEYRYEKKKHGEGCRCLIDKEHLNGIDIWWDSGSSYEGVVHEHEALLEDELQPHQNLKVLSIWHYKGVRIARWAKEHNLITSLPNLVSIELKSCRGLKELPWVSKLGCLKRLILYELENVEYMEENKNTSYGGDGERESSSGVIFFPALEELSISDMPKLKGWWGGSGTVDSNRNRQPAVSVVLPLPCFPRLSTLYIIQCPDLTSFLPCPNVKYLYLQDCHDLTSFPPCPNVKHLYLKDCPNLISIPPCPNLETLELREGVNERLRIITIKEEDVSGGSIMSSSLSSSSCQWSSTHPNLRKVSVYKNVGNLKCLQRGAFRCLRQMEIRNDSEVEGLSEIDEDLFRTCSSSLRSLQIEGFNKLRSLSVRGGGLENLIALEHLRLWSLPELSFDEEDTPWISFGQSLRSLKLNGLTKMEKLPKGMCHLTSLHSLMLSYCHALEELPEWIGDGCFSSLQSLAINKCPKMESLPDAMRNLTSLTTLYIWGCPPILKKRCKSPDGEDWHKIRHIPNFHICP